MIDSYVQAVKRAKELGAVDEKPYVVKGYWGHHSVFNIHFINADGNEVGYWHKYMQTWVEFTTPGIWN